MGTWILTRTLGDCVPVSLASLLLYRPCPPHSLAPEKSPVKSQQGEGPGLGDPTPSRVPPVQTPGFPSS